MENMVRSGKEEMESGSRSDIHHTQRGDGEHERGDGEHEERKKWKADQEVIKSKVDCPETSKISIRNNLLTKKETPSQTYRTPDPRNRS
ncbi:hypothetical protein Tco_0516461, partial [Tanacetum coccineum]